MASGKNVRAQTSAKTKKEAHKALKLAVKFADEVVKDLCRNSCSIPDHDGVCYRDRAMVELAKQALKHS